MARAAANGIELEYEVLGSDDGEPLLLVMGLGAQSIAWPDGLCELFVREGFRVVRYDNRDVGLSTKFDDAEVDFAAAFTAAMTGGDVEAPYLLTDMAEDGFGLLDALGIESAHVVGASMGGMIAQTMAIMRPERVRTLTSIMSSTGDLAVGRPAPEAAAVLLERPPAERDAYVEHAVETGRVLAGPGFPFDEDEVRRRAAAAFDRCYHPEGVGRQLVATLASGDRTDQLRTLRVPALVIHGGADPLVALTGGEATAAAIPDARLVVIDGMGHSLPAGAWSRIAEAITSHARATSARTDR